MSLGNDVAKQMIWLLFVHIPGQTQCSAISICQVVVDFLTFLNAIINIGTYFASRDLLQFFLGEVQLLHQFFLVDLFHGSYLPFKVVRYDLGITPPIPSWLSGVMFGNSFMGYTFRNDTEQEYDIVLMTMSRISPQPR